VPAEARTELDVALRNSRRLLQLVNEILDLLSHVASCADGGALSRMLAVMKAARSTGAALVLAYDQGNYVRVLEDEAAVKAALERARGELEVARRGVK